MYAHQLKVRERKWMQTRSTYQSKKVQFEQEVDQSNIAAQRAYSKVQRQLYNARSLAILQNQEDFKKNYMFMEATNAKHPKNPNSLLFKHKITREYTRIPYELLDCI